MWAVNLKAKVVIVGITPGQTQMLNALKECRRQLDAGANESDAVRAAKLTGAFSGAMRPNLVGVLDAIGLHQLMGIPIQSSGNQNYFQPPKRWIPLSFEKGKTGSDRFAVRSAFAFFRRQRSVQSVMLKATGALSK